MCVDLPFLTVVKGQCKPGTATAGGFMTGVAMIVGVVVAAGGAEENAGQYRCGSDPAHYCSVLPNFSSSNICQIANDVVFQALEFR